jgi:alkylation response protein AidB-like acyl-CoA dehydrogenase
MDFALSAQQQLLVNSARGFLAGRCPPELVQALALDPRGFRADLWKEIATLGWPGLLVPATLGGSDGSLLDVVLLVEELGRACFPGPYVGSAVVATSILRAAQGRRHERILAALAAGERLCTLALTEASASFEPGAVAVPGDVGTRIEGRKLFVKDAHVASDFIAAVRGGDGINLLLLAADRPGITVVPMPTMSGDKIFEVDFAGVEVRPEDLLAPPGQGWTLVAPALLRGALARSAEMVGCAQRILELTVDHARVRVQSGRPIGAFQAIQHACADLLRDVESARQLVRSAAWRVQEGPGGAAEVAMAKAYSGEACLRVARRAHQVFGAIGYCEEHPLHLLHKRILAAGLDCGDAAHHLETVAQAIGLH